MGTKVYPSESKVSIIVGRAPGVLTAALWNRTIEPASTRLMTRDAISEEVGFFQSRLSSLYTE